MGEGLLLKYQLFQMSVDLKMLVFYLREYRVSLFFMLLKILSRESYLKLQIHRGTTPGRRIKRLYMTMSSMRLLWLRPPWCK